METRPAKTRPDGLDALFRPRNVAVIGATEKPGAVGRTTLVNLAAGNENLRVVAVNPNRNQVLGVPCFPHISATGLPIDLAVICTPAETVPGIIGECVQAGVGGAIILSAGFKEIGARGAELEQEVKRRISESPMRIIGPNCLGVQNPAYGLNASFAKGIAEPGSIAFLSQSGALMTGILDWSWREHVGFSAFVSLGSMLDVGWGDLIEYFGDDPETKAILIYMETVGDARAFLSAARVTALNKPVIVIKAGRSQAAAAAAASHTGALTGADDVLDAAFQRAGVLRVDRISELFGMVQVLGRQPRPSSPRLTVLTNAGGPAVLATDALVEAGAELTQLSPDSLQSLNTMLPDPWSHGNPIDVLGDAAPERYASALRIAHQDPETGGLLVILTPQDMTDPTGTAQQLADFAIQNRATSTVPLLASWMGAESVREGREILQRAGIPVFAYPDDAAQAFAYMWKYSSNLEKLYQTPRPVQARYDRRARATAILNRALQSHHTLLSELDSKQLLAAYGLPVTQMELAVNAQEAEQIAERMGYPVVLKLHSEVITHKSDVGGVQLNLQNAAQVREAFTRIQAGAQHHSPNAFQGVSVQPMVDMSGAYEVIVGSSPDPQFGPVIMFGAGGQMVELLKDRALELPPLNSNLARSLIYRTRIAKAFAGVRGRPPVNVGELETTLVRFSELVLENPRIREIEINPLLVSSRGVLALDARIIVYPAETRLTALPTPAIRPYPNEYVRDLRLDSGVCLRLRPIMPEDEPLLVRFHQELSEETVEHRYFGFSTPQQRSDHQRLVRICMDDYDRNLALVAEVRDEMGQPEIAGVARLSRTRERGTAEIAIVLADKWQRRGIGRKLLELLVSAAAMERIYHLFARVLATNFHMVRLLEKEFGFTRDPGPELEVITLRRQLPH